MNLYNYFKEEIIKIIETLISEDKLKANLDLSKITVDPPKDPSHGDLATNAAMVLAKEAHLSPVDLAKMIVPLLQKHKDIEKVSTAGPGFINMSMKDSFWAEQLKNILKAGTHYGDSMLGKEETVNVEYVSANPTGPLHIGHCRGAIVGDVLCSLLEKAGYKVVKEYYINDSGGQAKQLAHSVYQRYLEALGHPPSEIAAYAGSYLIPVGEELASIHGDKWVDQGENVWLEPIRAFAVDAMMKLIRKDLEALNIHQDVFTSEYQIAFDGKVEEAFQTLEKKGFIYQGILEPPKGKTPEDWEPRVQTLFKATQFGDDIDRPLKKSDGSWTYFANDIAYHYDKYKRGATTLIDVLGADHGGYVKRISAAVKAFTDSKASVDVKICQIVHFMHKGEALKMSKRAGVFVTVKEAIEKVGRDVIRFMMVTRKNDAPMEFDFEKAIEQTRENPVFYVQYAHARCHSVKRHLLQTYPDLDISPQTLSNLDFLMLLKDPDEAALIKLLATWPKQIEAAAIAHEPHRIAFYLYEVAAAFHGLWNKGKENHELRFILPEDSLKTQKRYALIQAVMTIIASGLLVLGVNPLEEMR
jgi:arginyl-tRNA synthetase